MEKLKIENLRFAYHERDVYALDGINLTVNRGEFVTVCGASGCGKTTLLRHLKPSLTPHGNRNGTVIYDGKDITSLTQREECERIGFVMQSPEEQFVTDKVWHELAFGLESLGLPTSEIRARVAETAEYFGIADKFDSDVTQLSGGQKQLVNLASVMAMRPEILILDEPTSQLDPIAAAQYMAALGRLHRELGITVILREHRLEEAFPLSDRVIVMSEGKIIADAAPSELGRVLPREMYGFMPAASRIWNVLHETDGEIPITVRDGREFLGEYLKAHTPSEPQIKPICDGETVLSAHELHYRYESAEFDVVNGLSMHLGRGEILSILGGNGSGKSTLLSLLSGIYTPQSGEIDVKGKCVLMPQDVTVLFSKNTVRDELAEISSDYLETAKLCQIETLLDFHPFDLSGGEKQRLALAKVLLSNPDILLVDEPTKGMDEAFKVHFAEILGKLTEDGKSVIMVSHDAEFCAEVSDRCAMFFGGVIVSQSTPSEFFNSTNYYTTAAARITRGILPCATVREVVARFGASEPVLAPEKKKVSRALSDESSVKPQKRRITPFSVIAAIFMIIMIPLTVYFGGRYFGNRRYYITSLLVLFEILAGFVIMLEGKRPRTRELAVIASLCAIGVAGRAVFFMVPECKPVIAITIAAGAALGAGKGFTVGALTMLASNLIFGHGPWTPWQMVALGFVGFFAGVIFRFVKPSRITLCLYGIFASIVIYGGIMNPASMLLWVDEPTFELALTYFASGLPIDAVRAIATTVFLAVVGMPMVNRLSRVVRKYDI